MDKVSVKVKHGDVKRKVDADLALVVTMSDEEPHVGLHGYVDVNGIELEEMFIAATDCIATALLAEVGGGAKKDIAKLMSLAFVVGIDEFMKGEERE